MIRADLHCHTCFSHDCFASIAEVVETARRRELTALAITDHDRIEGAWRARDKSRDLQIIVGCEISLENGAHLLGLWLEQPVRTRHFGEVVAEIRAQGGVVIAPHPFHPFTGLFRNGIVDEQLRQLDALEVCNGHEPSDRNHAAVRLAREKEIPAIAGSDAHYGADVGRACIEFSNATGTLTPALLRTGARTLWQPAQDLEMLHAAETAVRSDTAPRARKFVPKAARVVAKWAVWSRYRQQVIAQCREPWRQPFTV